MPFHGGVDWGGDHHAVCIIDGAGQVVARIDVAHVGLDIWIEQQHGGIDMRQVCTLLMAVPIRAQTAMA